MVESRAREDLPHHSHEGQADGFHAPEGRSPGREEPSESIAHVRIGWNLLGHR
jgi:hypothetical protein